MINPDTFHETLFLYAETLERSLGCENEAIEIVRSGRRFTATLCSRGRFDDKYKYIATAETLLGALCELAGQIPTKPDPHGT